MRKVSGRRLAEAAGLLLVGVVAIAAEIAAIEGAITREPGAGLRYFVIGTIVGGMWLIVLRATLPTFRRSFVHDRKSLDSATEEHKRAIAFNTGSLIFLGMGLVGLAVVLGTTLNSSVRLGNAESTRAARNRKIRYTQDEIGLIRRRINDEQQRFNLLNLEFAELSLPEARPLSGAEKIRRHYLSAELAAGSRSITHENEYEESLQGKLHRLLFTNIHVGA
jgi:hypothetical protein